MKEAVMLLTKNDVVNGKFKIIDGILVFTMLLEISFILRADDCVLVNLHSDIPVNTRWILDNFNLNEDNTVTITSHLYIDVWLNET